MDIHIKSTSENLETFEEFKSFAIQNQSTHIYNPNLKLYRFPIINLYFLAVDKHLQNHGVSTLTLRAIFKNIMELKNIGLGFWASE